MRSPPWNDSENRALIGLYFEMLDKAVIGTPYNKAAMIRNARSMATEGGLNRSRGSIEAKLMNASAAHRDLGGEVTMDGFGYRCLTNYQAALKAAMLEEINDRQLTADIATSHANEQRAGA
ncbi:MAG: hypothetical protein KAQ88_08620 [Hyphomicrobiaceae bacterium]|nr:hypothetical protein [Hyphomicrobiaceae bacterium]